MCMVCTFGLRDFHQSQSLFFFLTHTVPSGPPQSVSVVPNSTTINLNIEEPLPEHQNGIITGYLVSLTQASSGRRQEFSPSRSTITIPSLTPYTRYFITVAAKTINGTGPPSESYEVSTLEAGEGHFNLFHHHACSTSNNSSSNQQCNNYQWHP